MSKNKPQRRFANPGDWETKMEIPLNRAEVISLLHCLMERIKRDDAAGEVVLPTVKLAQKLEYYLKETDSTNRND